MYIHFFALANEEADALDVAAFGIEKCRHELGRVVSFEVGGAIGNHGVTCSMGAVKTVASEWREEFPNGTGNFFGDAVFNHAGDEFDFLFIEKLLNLLTDSFSECVSFGQSVTGEV